MFAKFGSGIAQSVSGLASRLVAMTMLLAFATPASAQADGAYLRVVDVGAGLCVVAVTPDGHSMVFDAGRGSERCTEAVRELIPGRRIDLLVLSHSDADHVGATRGCCQLNANLSPFRAG